MDTPISREESWRLQTMKDTGKDTEFLDLIGQELQRIENQQFDPKLRRAVQAIADAIDRAGARIANAILVLAESQDRSEFKTVEKPPDPVNVAKKGLSVHIKSPYRGHRDLEDLDLE